jgi:hypothetical protein
MGYSRPTSHLHATVAVVCRVLTCLAHQCLGLLMGCAIRTRALMPLSLPSLFWKPLVGLPVTLTDLEAVTQSLVRGVIQPLRDCRTEAEFDQLFGFGNLRWYYVIPCAAVTLPDPIADAL